MWKNQTTPNLKLYLQKQIAKKQQKHYQKSNINEKYNEQFGALHKQQGMDNIQSRPINYNSRGSILFDKKNKCKHIEKQNKNNKTQLERSCSQISIKGKHQDFLLSQLEQNEKLRINLFKAQKTIKDLDQMCKEMLTKSLNLRKQENACENTKIKNKQTNQSQSLWKNNFNILFQFIDSFTKDVNFLTQQYNKLQLKNEQYKKTTKNIRKSEQNLVKILQHSNTKLEKSEQIIERLLAQIKQRDYKLQDFQNLNKNLNMKIIEQRDQIQKMKRQAKQQKMGGDSYKQVAKTLKHQLQNMAKLCKQYQKELSVRDKAQFQNRNTLNQLNQRVNYLNQELDASKKFNENIMLDYKKMAMKIEQQQQKMNQKFQNCQIINDQKTKQYEKYINILHRQKQLSGVKFEEKLQNKAIQIEKLNEIKISLQKELLERTFIINQLEQQILKQKQKHQICMLDIETRLEQKQRQLQYHQQLKVIANMKNQELSIELNEARNDMKTILQQLKVKELEIEKFKEMQSLKSISSKKCLQYIENGQTSQQKQQKYKKGSNESRKNKQSKRQLLQIQIDQNQRNSLGGIVWRKLKRDSTTQDNNNAYQYNNIKAKTFSQKNNSNGINSRVQFKIDNYVQNDGNQYHSYQNQQNQESSVIQVPPLLNLQTSYRNPLQKLDEPDTPKKFSLQAFQNKMAIQESAKIFFKFNKAMLR